LDTSAVIALRNITDASTLPVEPLITAVTLAELSAGPLVARDETGTRGAAGARAGKPKRTSTRCPSNRASARAFGQVAASLRASGRNTAARACDALIAATALARQLPVYTCNPADFDKIDGLKVVPVGLPERASG